MTVPNLSTRVLLRSEESGGHLSIIDNRVPARATGPDLHRHDFDEAFYILEARTWRPDGHRLGGTIPYYQHAWPGCDVGALLQRLTIDSATPTELGGRLRAAQDGFAAEGRSLALPDLDVAELAVLGPRLAPDTIDRLRLLACPVTAAALMLALATDTDAVELRPQRADRNPDHDVHQVALIAGRCRIPARARPLLRAAIYNHEQPCAPTVERQWVRATGNDSARF